MLKPSTSESCAIAAPASSGQRIARASGLAVAAVGVAVLIGWQIDLEHLKRLVPTLVAMNPATAVAFILAGTALWLQAVTRPSRSRRRAARSLATVVALVGLVKLLAYLGVVDLRIDQFLFASRLPGGGPAAGDGVVLPNRMAPNTAMLFVVTGAALVLSPQRSVAAHLAGKMLAAVVALLAIVAVIGYLNDVTSLYRPTTFIPIALHTALAFLALSMGAIMLGAQHHAGGKRHASGPGAEVRLTRLMEENITATVAAALFLVCVVQIVAYASIREFAGDSRRNAHTHQVLGSVAELAAVLKDADAGARGYLITGQDRFLDPYHAAVASMATNIEALRSLTVDTPAQQQRLDALAPLIAAKLAFLDEAITVRRAGGLDAAARLLAEGQGKRTMDDSRRVLEQMRDHARKLIEVRTADTADSAAATIAVISIGSVLVLTLVGVSGWLVRRDMHLRKRVEAELRRTRDAADQSNRAKSQFLANMSHEIRTPMTAIIGYADLLLDARQNQSDRLNHVNTIRRNGDHLLALINDILDLSKIEAGKLTVDQVDCSPGRIVSDVASLMRVRASEKGLPFKVCSEGPIPESIRSDPTRLRQVLINMVGNAMKFTEAGWVRLTVSMDRAEPDHPMLRFDVIDTGIGMTPAQLDRLFQPFAQADASTTRRFGGTGLGLTICNHMAEMLGGRIDVDSSPGRGSTFSLLIDPGPLESACWLDNWGEAMQGFGAGARPAKVHALHGRILLVDDGVDNRQLLSVYLRQAGASVTLAKNGQIGCHKALSAMARGKPFNMILMDMQMPVLDGYGATARLRAKGYAGPIVALTAHAMTEDRARCIQAGCTDYLSKPIRRDELLMALSRYLPSTTADDEADLDADAPAHEPPPPEATSLSGTSGGSSEGAFGGTPGGGPSWHAGGALRTEPLDEAVRPFFDSFVARLPRQVGRLQQLIARGELDQAREIVHNLKGTGGLYGLMPITEKAAEAEQRIESRAALESIIEQVDELIATVRSVEGYDPSREAARGEA